MRCENGRRLFGSGCCVVFRLCSRGRGFTGWWHRREGSGRSFIRLSKERRWTQRGRGRSRATCQRWRGRRSGIFGGTGVTERENILGRVREALERKAPL